MRDRCTEGMGVGPALQQEWGRCQCELSWSHEGDHAIYLDAAGAAGLSDRSEWGFWTDHVAWAIRVQTDCDTHFPQPSYGVVLSSQAALRAPFVLVLTFLIISARLSHYACFAEVAARVV